MQYLVDIEKLIKKPIEQVVIPGFDPEYDYEYPPSGRRVHHRRPSEPSASVAPATRARREHGERSERSPAPVRRKSHIAADGFDFDKPYECAAPQPVAAPADTESAEVAARMEHLRKPRRLVAALLGGLGRSK